MHKPSVTVPLSAATIHGQPPTDEPVKLGVIIPCYNEQDVLPETCKRVIALLDHLVAAGKIADSSQMLFVDDGSRDRTWALIKEYAASHPRITGIKLSRNRGHQNALIAGLFTAEGDALVTVDADLQDDLAAIEAMVDRFLAGADVVYGVRKHRETDKRFKRLTASLFYKLMAALGAESIDNHADYRLMSRRAIECLKQYNETNLFLRGIVPLIGFKSEIVTYNRSPRLAGESKYPLRKMVALALDGITSFSVIPLRIITLIGFVVFLVSMGLTAWVLWARFITHRVLPGWASIVLPMYFLGGIQLFCIGMLGEYLGKIYAEVKSRPRYFVEETAGALDAPRQWSAHHSPPARDPDSSA